MRGRPQAASDSSHGSPARPARPHRQHFPKPMSNGATFQWHRQSLRMRQAAARMGTHSPFGASKLALYIGMLFAKPNRHRGVTAALRVRAGKPLAVFKKKGTRMTAQDVIRLGRIGLVLAAAS